jgi:alanyl-tRNA synthetase
MIGINDFFCTKIAEEVIATYPEYELKAEMIFSELNREEEKFTKTLEQGLKEFARRAKKQITGEEAFLLFQSYGFPLEMTMELAAEKGIKVDEDGFRKAFRHHQELSRKGAEQMFKGGLADTSERTVRMHTATHLLNEALRKAISPEIHQRGSNITPERLRFDFNFDRKLTADELKKVEELVNKKIKEAVDVERKEMPFEQAKKLGAEMEFGAKYPDVVSVYFIGDFSKEFCGGPHVENTKDIGRFKIIKEEGIAAGVRRIKAVVE